MTFQSKMIDGRLLFTQDLIIDENGGIFVTNDLLPELEYDSMVFKIGNSLKLPNDFSDFTVVWTWSMGKL